MPKSNVQDVDFKSLPAFCTVVDGCEVNKGPGVVRRELWSERVEGQGKGGARDAGE